MRVARWRAPAIAAGVVVALIVAAVLLGVATPGPRGPTSSSFATAPDGTAAWASLLARSGHPVTRLRRRLDDEDTPLPRGATLVLLDPDGIADGEVAALHRFLLGGGSAVLGGASDQDWLREAIVGVPRLRAGGDAAVRPFLPVAQTAGVRALQSAGDAAFASGGRLLPIAGGRRGAIALAGGTRGGRVTVVADASPVQNRLLGKADNAAFALAIAGGAGRPVVFSELQHGDGRTGLNALPTRWKVALVLAALAALALIVSRGRRLGPAEAPERELPPPRRAYVDALADALGRTRRPDDAAAPVRARARRTVAGRTGLAADAPDPEVRAAALRLGLDDDEADAVLGAGSPVAAGAALARLQGGER